MGAPAASAVRSAAAAVCDPEFPGITIEDLGVLEDVRVGPGGDVSVDLLPTFLGCPALDVIAGDVEAAVATVPGVSGVSVRFLAAPSWTPDRITPEGRDKLATEFTVAVRRREELSCPVCASTSVEDVSPFGPTACRAVAYCPQCRNPIEVMRR